MQPKCDKITRGVMKTDNFSKTVG